MIRRPCALKLAKIGTVLTLLSANAPVFAASVCEIVAGKNLRIQREVETRMTIERARNIDGSKSPRTMERFLSEVVRQWAFRSGGLVLRPLGAQAQYFHAGSLISLQENKSEASPYIRELNLGEVATPQFGETAAMRFKFRLGAQSEHIKIWRTAGGAILRQKEWRPIGQTDLVTNREIYFKTPGQIVGGIWHDRMEHRMSLPLDAGADEVKAFGRYAEETLGLTVSSGQMELISEFINERWGLNFCWLAGQESYTDLLKAGRESSCTRIGKITFEHSVLVNDPSRQIFQMAVEIEPEHLKIVTENPRHWDAFADYFNHYYFGRVDLRSKHEQLDKL